MRAISDDPPPTTLPYSSCAATARQCHGNTASRLSGAHLPFLLLPLLLRTATRISTGTVGARARARARTRAIAVAVAVDVVACCLLRFGSRLPLRSRFAPSCGGCCCSRFGFSFAFCAGLRRTTIQFEVALHSAWPGQCENWEATGCISWGHSVAVRLVRDMQVLPIKFMRLRAPLKCSSSCSQPVSFLRASNTKPLPAASGLVFLVERACCLPAPIFTTRFVVLLLRCESEWAHNLAQNLFGLDCKALLAGTCQADWGLNHSRCRLQAAVWRGPGCSWRSLPLPRHCPWRRCACCSLPASFVDTFCN